MFNDTLKTMKERRSIRKYKSEQICSEELECILEAGTWAASGKNAQSAIMVVVQDEETISILSKINAEIMNIKSDPFYGAPTCVVVLADSRKNNWLQDGSLVMGNLMNAAWSIGIGSCWINRMMETFDSPEGKTLLAKWGVPKYYRGVGSCILGYIDGEIPIPKARKEQYILKV